MKTKLLHWGAFLLMLVVMTACSNNSKSSELLKVIPADMDLVVVGDVETALQSAGGSLEDSRLQIPVYITDQLSKSEMEKVNELNSFLKSSGVNIQACAFAGRYESNSPFVIFKIDDLETFKKALGEAEYREWEIEEKTLSYLKTTYYSEDMDYNRYDFLAVHGEYGYWVENVYARQRAEVWKDVKNLIQSAQEKSMADMPYGKYMAEGNVLGVSFRIPREFRREMSRMGISSDLVNMYDGCICLKGDLTDDAAQIRFKWFDEEGKAKSPKDFAKFLNMEATVNPDVLAYLPKDEHLVYAATLKGIDWDSYLNMIESVMGLRSSERAQMVIAKSYLEKFDGTMAVGFGLTQGVTSAFNLSHEEEIMDQFVFTVLCETKEGKAKSLINDLKTLLSNFNGVEYSSRPSGLTVNLPENQGSVYLEAKDDVLILSNRPVKKHKDNATVQEVSFKDKLAAIGLVLPRTIPLMRDFGLENDAKMEMSFDAKEFEFSMEMALTGQESVGFIEKFVKSIQQIESRQDQLREKWQDERHRRLYETPDTDSMYSDSAALDSVVADSVAYDYGY